MKIAFVGDSFCAEHKFPECTPWTKMLLEEYNATSIQKGIDGDCLFHAYQKLLKVVDDTDYIIICVTEPDRLPNMEELPISISIAESHSHSLSKDIRKAALMYYKHLINRDFHRAAHLGILMQADQLILEKKKKCIWFWCFHNSSGERDFAGLQVDQSYKIRSGPHGNTPLINFTEQNTLIPTANHFSKEQNENMFTLIKDIIDKDAFEPKPIDMNII